MKTLEELKKYLAENGYEDTIVYDNPAYVEAFIGMSNEDRAVYSYTKMIESLCVNDNMSYDEAVEFIDYNTLGAFYNEKQPVVLFDLEE